ncbi:uncharacterized protein LOC109503602 [Harpegnathos saltator]|uniref:uncharacterized protein LOC109503602 n=1 Tax=Harpegnathos saltator TaxID=610380 RepID=UPI000948D816|nr:uncharacterized protein LOC109503602 [Harpegnathos saltator]
MERRILKMCQPCLRDDNPAELRHCGVSGRGVATWNLEREKKRESISSRDLDKIIKVSRGYLITSECLRLRGIDTLPSWILRRGDEVLFGWFLREEDRTSGRGHRTLKRTEQGGGGGSPPKRQQVSDTTRNKMRCSQGVAMVFEDAFVVFSRFLSLKSRGCALLETHRQRETTGIKKLYNSFFVMF